jgi:hypothetical protein
LEVIFIQQLAFLKCCVGPRSDHPSIDLCFEKNIKMKQNVIRYMFCFLLLFLYIHVFKFYTLDDHRKHCRLCHVIPFEYIERLRNFWMHALYAFGSYFYIKIYSIYELSLS